MCSLAICKPGIRSTARKGDWVAGLGSRNADSGDLSGRLVYAMRVEEVVSLREYDKRAASDWPHRIPNAGSADLSDRLGDCIYDYSRGVPVQRPGGHGAGNVETTSTEKMSSYRAIFIISAAKPSPSPTICFPFVTRPRGTRAMLMLPIFSDL